MPSTTAAPREAIGYRIARIRDTAGMTQEQLADRVGVSKPYVSMVENGKRAITKRSRLIEFAEALGVPITVLTGQPYEPTTRHDLEHHLIIPQIRMSLDEPDEGPVSPRSLTDLDAVAELAMAARMNCDIADLGRHLPGLISETRVLWFEDGNRQAGELLVKAAVTGSLALKAAGWVDLGVRLADLADTVATSLGDPVCRAAATFAVAQAALAVGSRKRSARLAIAGAEDLDRLSRTKLPPKILNDVLAWLGVLQLHGALSVAALDNGDPDGHLAEARAAARHVTGDPWRMEFSDANVGTWAVGIALENGHPEQAPQLARLVDPNKLRTRHRRSRLWYDTGRGLYIAGDSAGATKALLAADREAPGDLRTRAAAIEIVAQMVRDAPQHGGSEQLRDLAVKVGVNPFAPDPVS
jgi:transcriptional regulator with XRE-family HTH domain